MAPFLYSVRLFTLRVHGGTHTLYLENHSSYVENELFRIVFDD